jgi:hypothetical protein
MIYVIGLPRVDVKGRACVEERRVEAIYYEDDLPQKWRDYTADNARFFTETLPGQPRPLGSPGRARKPGQLNPETAMVADLPPQSA